MNKIAFLLASAALSVPARAFADIDAATALSNAQAAKSNADAAVATAFDNEANFKAALDQAKSALDGATDENREALTTAHATAKSAFDVAAKAHKAAKTEAGKADKAVTKAQNAATKEAEKAKKAAEKEAAKAAKAAEAEQNKAANKMPEQNGIRKPKPDSACGKAWSVFDAASAARGEPASISETLPIATGQGINEATVRTQYARWRKFHNVSGRIEAPKAPEVPAAPVAPAVPEVPAA
jgi:hypothetical protein